jgi:predicted RNA-binding Zn-ribbon protein involved in translation (DUF1610 family)
MRYRVLGISLAIVLAAVSVITLSTLPAWPIIGVAVASMVVVINTVANRLQQPICHACGLSLASAKFGTHGTICPECGAVNQPRDVSTPWACRLRRIRTSSFSFQANRQATW